MHSYIFPHKEGRVFWGSWRVFFWGGGWRFMKTWGFRFLNLGFRNLRKKRQPINKFDRHPFPGQSRKDVHVYWFFSKSWFSGRGWGQQLFSFQSPAVQWMARTSSLNCLSCRNPYQAPDSLNCLPPFHWKPLFSLKSASSHPLQPKIGSDFRHWYDRMKVPPCNGSDAPSALEVLKPLCFQLYPNKYHWWGHKGCMQGTTGTSLFMSTENNSDHPHPLYLQKICPQNMPYNGGSVWHESRLNSSDFYRKYGIRTPKYGIRTPPFMPYEPFLLGVGVVFNLLIHCPVTRSSKRTRRPEIITFIILKIIFTVTVMSCIAKLNPFQKLNVMQGKQNRGAA